MLLLKMWILFHMCCIRFVFYAPVYWDVMALIPNNYVTAVLTLLHETNKSKYKWVKKTHVCMHLQILKTQRKTFVLTSLLINCYPPSNYKKSQTNFNFYRCCCCLYFIFTCVFIDLNCQALKKLELIVFGLFVKCIFRCIHNDRLFSCFTYSWIFVVFQTSLNYSRLSITSAYWQL